LKLFILYGGGAGRMVLKPEVLDLLYEHPEFAMYRGLIGAWHKNLAQSLCQGTSVKEFSSHCIEIDLGLRDR
jgi:hypothetical protein